MSNILLKPYDGDPPYHPDDQDQMCLSESLVEEILRYLKEEDQIDQELMDLIKKHESIHREYIVGGIDLNKKNKLINNMFESYRQKHQRWAHQEQEYQEFYRIANNGNWT